MEQTQHKTCRLTLIAAMEHKLRGKNVVIMGLGRNGGGLAAAKFCLLHGAEVCLSDTASEESLASSLAELECFLEEYRIPKQRLLKKLGGHDPQDFARAQLIVKNPGVPQDSPLLSAAKCSWTTDLALFLEAFPQQPVFAVTGTKGKSSICHALHYLLLDAEPSCQLGGNIGRSPLSFYPLLQAHSPVVLELSSWQLADLRAVSESTGKPLLQPRFACISNLMLDHQNRYSSFWDYSADKKYIYKNLAANSLLMLPFAEPSSPPMGSQPSKVGLQGPASLDINSFFADELLRAYSQQEEAAQDPPKLAHFPLLQLAQQAYRARPSYSGVYLQASGAYISAPSAAQAQLLISMEDFFPLGRPALLNFAIAAYASLHFGQSLERIKELAKGYRGVPHRMEYLGAKQLSSAKNTDANRALVTGPNLQFYNDSTATMPDAAIAALETSISSGAARSYIILGGADKKLEKRDLVQALQRSEGQVFPFLLAGQGTDALIADLSNRNVPYHGPFTSLQKAFSALTEHAEGTAASEGIAGQGTWHCLLSPGYASFGMFQNEFDRAAQFCGLVAIYLESQTA